jgi:hypothetical protein
VSKSSILRSQYLIGREPDGIGHIPPFQRLVERGQRKGRVGSDDDDLLPSLVAVNDGQEDLLPPVDDHQKAPLATQPWQVPVLGLARQNDPVNNLAVPELSPPAFSPFFPEAASLQGRVQILVKSAKTRW